MEQILDAATEADHAFKAGHIERLDSATLRMHLMAIANQPSREVKNREVVRALWLNHVLLQRHIDRLNRRTNRLYWVVVALATCAIVSSLAGIVAALTPAPHKVEIIQKARE